MNGRREMTLKEAQSAYLNRVEEIHQLQSKTVRWVCLYNDDEAHVARHKMRYENDNVLFNIPIYPWHNNKQARMLFCYANGHVNVLNPYNLLKDKLRYEGFKKSGYNKSSQLMRVFVCDKKDYLVICSRNSQGFPYIKAVSLDSRTVHASMCAMGNIFVKEGTPYRWMLVPWELKSWIRPIILRNTGLGYPLEEYIRYKDLIEFEKWASKVSTPPMVSIS